MLKEYISPLGVKRRMDVREMGDVKRGFLAMVGVLCLPVSASPLQVKIHSCHTVFLCVFGCLWHLWTKRFRTALGR